VTPDPADAATDAETAAGDADPGDGPLGATTDAFAAGIPGTTDSWVRDYLRDHAVHLVVIALFAAYPFVYSFLTTSVLPAEFTTLLPGINLMVGVLFFGLFAMSFDFISGYTGYLSFGHAVFYGIGAYFVVMSANGKMQLLIPHEIPAVGGTVLFHVAGDTPFMILLVMAGLVAAAAALAIGAVSFRLTGVYFAMITLGFSQVAFVFVSNWNYIGSEGRTAVTGRSEAFQVGVPYVDALNFEIAAADFVGQTVDVTLAGQRILLSAAEASFFMIGLVVLVCYFAMQRIVHSPFGRVMVAIRDNEERAEALGYNTYRYKLVTFAVSGFFAAVAGGLFAGYARAINPEETLFFLVAGDALLAAIIGGFGTLAGALFGWLLFQSLQELLTSNVLGGTPDGLLPYLEELLGEGALAGDIVGDLDLATVLEVWVSGRASLYIGVVFVLFVLYVPNGILGTLRLWLGGTVAKAVPDRLLGPRGGDDDSPTGPGAD
jgi:branched-chain amino acid transport system permease protein